MKKFLFANILYSSLIIFYQIIPAPIVAAVGVCYIFWAFSKLQKIHGVKWALIILSVSSIPTSFVSVFGTSTGEVPLSWYHVLGLVLVFFVMQSGAHKDYFFMLFCLGAFGIALSLAHEGSFNGISQLLMILLTFFAFLIGASTKGENTQERKESLYWTYISGTISMYFQLQIQYICINQFGLLVGKHDVMASRVAYSGVMSDYSFVSLYLATGMLLVLIRFLEEKKGSIIQFAVLECMFMAGILITTARTGLYALIAIVVLYLVTHIKKLKIKYFFILLVGVLCLPIVFEVLQSSRGAQALLDGSGRIVGYLKGIEYFLDNPLCGVGLGVENYRKVTGLTIPHNFFIQYLVQTGIVGTVLICAPLVYFTLTKFKKFDNTVWVLILVFTGAMFIPDITSSRFLYGVILLVWVYLKEDKVQSEIKI